MLGLGHDLGHVQQGLRGDAAAQQADAAQPRLEVDQRDLHAQIGGQEGGGVAARSAADDDKLGVHGKGLGIRGKGEGDGGRGKGEGEATGLPPSALPLSTSTALPAFGGIDHFVEEAAGGGAVHQAVVVGQAQRQHQPRFDAVGSCRGPRASAAPGPAAGSPPRDG